MNSKQIDEMYQAKLFLMNMYRDIIERGNNFRNNEKICCCKKYVKDGTSLMKQAFFNNLDDMLSYAVGGNRYIDTYFSLATMYDDNRQTESLATRTTLAFDFDKKELGNEFSHKDVLNKFKQIGLYYHALIDSGHGYHAYVFIEPTQDLDKVEKLQKAISKLVGSDAKANLKTQILRLPFTFNVKSDDIKRCNIVYLDKEPKRKTIEALERKYINMNTSSSTKNIDYVIKSNNRICVNEILLNGSCEGNRNEDLKKIVVALRNQNRSLANIKIVCDEWNTRNTVQINQEELYYQIEYMYNNLKSTTFECSDCKYFKDCYSKKEKTFTFDVDDIEKNLIFMVNSKAYSKLKYKKRKGSFSMDGYQLLIYNVLCNNINKKYDVDDIMKLTTYKKNQAISMRKLKDVLQELEQQNIIKCDVGTKRLGIKNKYYVNLDKKINTIEISYFTTLAVIWGVITPEELRLYTYLRYKIEEMRTGNTIRINQDQLAVDLGCTQVRISQMINNLVEAKIIDIHTNVSENNNIYYTYKLNK